MCKQNERKAIDCFNTLQEETCQKSNCKYWFGDVEFKNCSIGAAANGGHTFADIGQVFNISRAKVCQIERSIFDVLRKSL
jgi:hypothetical protein